MKSHGTWRIVGLAAIVLGLDQLTKFLIQRNLLIGEERAIIPGFLNLVHWHNTGAAWSMFRGYNWPLAFIGGAALIILFFSRHHFDVHTMGGQISLGLIFGGIVGNLTDRLLREHVIDFLYFYVVRRDGRPADFPAFNVADSAICVGVALLFVLSWRAERPAPSDS